MGVIRPAFTASDRTWRHLAADLRSHSAPKIGARACHIGWAATEAFYRRAGYQPWRRYAMFHSSA
jgi:hypothetical protein